MTQQSILHLVVNWEVFTINLNMPPQTRSSDGTSTAKILNNKILNKLVENAKQLALEWEVVVDKFKMFTIIIIYSPNAIKKQNHIGGLGMTVTTRQNICTYRSHQ